jgi:hypothetical protein
MRKRILHTSVNLLMEPDTYQRLKRAAKLKKIPMSKIIREGTKIRLDQIEKETDVVMGGHKS